MSETQVHLNSQHNSNDNDLNLVFSLSVPLQTHLIQKYWLQYRNTDFSISFSYVKNPSFKLNFSAFFKRQSFEIWWLIRGLKFREHTCLVSQKLCLWGQKSLVHMVWRPLYCNLSFLNLIKPNIHLNYLNTKILEVVDHRKARMYHGYLTFSLKVWFSS